MTQELRAMNQQETISLWMTRISECRSSDLSVAQWCKENEICVQTYYRWQKRLYEMAQTQQGAAFVDVTPRQKPSAGIAVTLQIGSAEAQIYNGADTAAVETVLRLLKSC